MIKTLLINTLFISFLFTGVHSALYPNRPVSLPDNVFEIDYSPNQVFLGAISPTRFILFEGRTGLQLQRINTSQQTIINSFGFSWDNKWLALGLNDGQVDLYKYDQVAKKFLKTSMSYESDVKSNVTGVCFSPDNNYLVIGLVSDQLVVWDLIRNEASTGDFDSELVLTISCSPTQNKFAVGGGLNTLAQLALFQFDAEQNGSISRIYDFNDPTNSTPYGTTFSSEGDMLYSVGKNATITIFNITSSEQTQITIENMNDPLKKVRVSNNGNIIAVATNLQSNNKIYVVNNTEALYDRPSLLRRQLFTEQLDKVSDMIIVDAVQTLDTLIASVALSPRGEKIFYVDGANKGQIEGTCEQNYFADLRGECQRCNQNCTLCQQSRDQCFECKTSRYLNQNKLCLECIVGCINCQDGESCLRCDTDSHFIIDQNDSSCVCEPSYFLNVTDECEQCIDGCLVCNDSDTCITCDDSKGFILKDGECVCPPGSFEELGQCISCIRGCQTCINTETCQNCSKEQHYIQDQDNICICDDNEHFIDDGQNCVCQVGYYLDSTLNTCQKCRLGCTECSAADICTQCKPGLRLENDLCVCQNPGQYIDVDEVCKSCRDAISFCDACVSATECTECQAGIDRHLEDGACPCDNGFYPQNGTQTCLRCQQIGCVKCDGPQECLECNFIEHWTLNTSTGECQCLQDYVEQDNKCIDCPDGCKVCESTDLSCIECQEDWQLDGLGGCRCQSGFYEDNKTCMECMVGCTNCTEQETCIQCDTTKQFVLNGTTQECECVSGFYVDMDKKQCISCSETLTNCEKCSSATRCTSCFNPFKVTSKGDCGCDKGKYVNGNKCSECQQGCLECTGAQNCSKCDKNYQQENGICKQNGLDTLIIVLIVIGVLAVAGAVFALVKCVKKKRSPLSEDYEEL